MVNFLARVILSDFDPWPSPESFENTCDPKGVCNTHIQYITQPEEEIDALGDECALETDEYELGRNYTSQQQGHKFSSDCYTLEESMDMCKDCIN